VLIGDAPLAAGGQGPGAPCMKGAPESVVREVLAVCVR
jgi:hypothetical protein